DHAEEMTERQRVSAHDLLEAGIVHVVVPERPAAHEDPEGFARAVARTCADQIRELVAAG
ncbi:MAG: acyl-CoA carboxylase subunit beta, partial [Actinomycetota bacterium]|nr:acyl-CoA carboxylase subunit beta [Actinomycetota bacterium]